MTTPALAVTMTEGVAVITFDLAGEAVNKLSTSVAAEFEAILAGIERNTAVRAVVLISGKHDGFIAGADIDEFLQYGSAGEAAAASGRGQALLQRIEDLRAPVVAAINGACLGGGLEAALACRYRIATDQPKTLFAFPETQLGLIPGAGGTQRLPRTIGLQAALDMILTARNVRARKALQSGLVDELVHPGILKETAITRARELAAGGLSGRHARRHGAMSVVLEENPIGRAVVFRQARELTLKKSRGNYPALVAALAAVQAGYHRDQKDGYAEEARLFGEMAMTSVSRQLVFLFFATSALKKDVFPRATGAADALPVHKLGVLGTGFMGAGIAAVSAMQNIPVRFKDANHRQVGRGLAAVRELLKDRLTKRQITRQQFDDQCSLVSGTIEYSGFASVPLVIEAVFEELDVKHAVLAEVEAVLSPSAIVASNTSTIPIAEIAARSRRPERVIGMHFFSPVQKMPLLEVIVTPKTAPAVLATAVAFGRSLGKTVIVVNDSPGFFVNRILAPYINEAGRMLDEGVAIDVIDRALLEFGFPVGPVTLLDEVGLDVAGKSGSIMARAFGDRLQPAASLGAVLASGRLGRKARKGFYLYGSDGKRGGVDDSVYTLLPSGARRAELSMEEIQQRCVMGMVNEAVRCLEEGIVGSPRDGDIGAVFGIGFPPFRGGPYRHIDAVGVAEIVRQLEALNGLHRGRFEPCRMLVEMARDGARFYPATGRPV